MAFFKSGLNVIIWKSQMNLRFFKILTIIFSAPFVFSCSLEYIDPITEIEFVKINSGCFEMGSNTHETCIENDFYLGKYEVTQKQWLKVIGRNYSSYKSKYHPVENVTIDQVLEFIRRLNHSSGKHYRLPTDAEWEYACLSGGNKQKFCGSNNYTDVSWGVDENNFYVHHRVGGKMPNDYGLYDMTGNVSEFTCSVVNSMKKSSQGICNTISSVFTVRGGSWNEKKYPPLSTETESVLMKRSHYRSDTTGFRLLLEL